MIFMLAVVSVTLFCGCIIALTLIKRKGDIVPVDNFLQKFFFSGIWYDKSGRKTEKN